MPFVDFPLAAHPLNKEVSGLAVSQTAPMTLQVATGSVQNFQTGTTCTLAAAQSEVFVADATYPTQVFVALIDDGVNCDVWFDSYVSDGFNARGDVPTGYQIIVGLAWFSIAPNETDLLNGDVNRRIWQ